MFYVLMNIECINVYKHSVNSMIMNTQKRFALKRKVNQNIKKINILTPKNYLKNGTTSSQCQTLSW